MMEKSYCCYLTDNLLLLYHDLIDILYSYNYIGDHLLHVQFPVEVPTHLLNTVKLFIDTVKEKSLNILYNYPYVCETCEENTRMLISNYENLNYY